MQLLGLYSLFSALECVHARLSALTPTACDIITSGDKFTLFSSRYGYWNFDSSIGVADKKSPTVLNAKLQPDGTSFWLKIDTTHYLAPNPDATAYFFRTVTAVADEAATNSAFGAGLVLSIRRWSCLPMGPNAIALIDSNGYSPKPTPYHSESDSPWPYLISASVDVLFGPSPEQTWIVDRV
ncbi:hypothetical protein SDRG_12764 [Saprolegnia diclina VS20]|uniref:Uncharacterized protein n=1 Tax=Saprolegnia diclina (strain VS20) TaxID=1156394 RepID=T0Q7T6_SAPDV|nr:hypothetical protein SDRG_12764 [Saprolegnia diclina VS20]EQC29515.1 hypothetical protein SDRG_12764 [Saprolegnia diclina VS20]|eukprot:XP_008617067.1 hypothetical protein SDRG_12764 [Saprolegnia diclina VS20]